MEPDDNDIVVTTYGPDFLNIFEFIKNAVTDQGFWAGIKALLIQIWEVYSIIAFILSGIFIIGIVYAYIRFNQLSEIEMNQLLDAEKEWKRRHGGSAENNEWKKISSHLASDNPNDWKLAIIEADIMLERILNDAGFAGNTVGEKLKSASPNNFTTLQDAWDAHIIRNKIAHQGSDFVLTQRTAQEAIIKFERVFNEFNAL